jgi:hypothetical protein
MRSIQSNRTAESPPKRLAGVMRLGSDADAKTADARHCAIVKSSQNRRIA